MSDKKKKRLIDHNWFRLLLAVFLLGCCAGLGASIAILEDKSDPTEYVAAYFGKYLMQDYKGMYTYVDSDNICLTEESFAAIMKKERESVTVGNYEFEKPVKKDGRYVVKVVFEDLQSEKEKTFDIYLVKHRESYMQLVADWKISVDDYGVDAFTVSMPEGMALQIDDEVIEKSDVVSITTDKNMQTYKIGRILKGTHKLSAITDYTQITTTKEIKEDKLSVELSEKNIKPSEKYKALIEENSKGVIKEFYEAVRNRKTSSKALLKYFSTDKKVINKVKSLAEKNQEIIFWPDTKNIDDYTLKELKFSELKYKAEYKKPDKYKVTYTYSYDYTSSTDVELYTSYIFSIQGKCKTTMELTYTIKDDNIVVSDIVIKNNNKKLEED